MKQGQFRVRLRPLCGGTFTQVHFCGVVPTVAPPRLKLAMRRMAEMLAFWSGWPVAVVLSVAPETACWCDSWVAILQDIPERHLEVRFARCADREPAKATP